MSSLFPVLFHHLDPLCPSPDDDGFTKMNDDNDDVLEHQDDHMRRLSSFEGS